MWRGLKLNVALRSALRSAPETRRQFSAAATPTLATKKKTAKKPSQIKRVKGTRDFLPPSLDSSSSSFSNSSPTSSTHHAWVVRQCVDVARRYGYDEIITPTLEQHDVYTTTLGEASDVVSHQCFNVSDGPRRAPVTLRPEGTAGVVRALVASGALQQHSRDDVHHLCYHGSMFRRERPQQGRHREFTQFGVEAIGGAVPLPMADVECIALAHSTLVALGVADVVTLRLNSLGSPASRDAFAAALLAYLTPLSPLLSEESRRRVAAGDALRVLDSKSGRSKITFASVNY
jgi:histidyl-tRNA synthetase